MQRFKADGDLSGLVLFDRDTELQREAFDDCFKLIMQNLIIHGQTIAADKMLAGCLSVSHIRYEVRWERQGRITVLNYEDDRKYYESVSGVLKIRNPVNMLNFNQVVRPKGLKAHTCIALNPNKIKSYEDKIAIDTDAFKNDYCDDLTITEHPELPSVYHNIIDNFNFIYDLGGYKPYEKRDVQSGAPASGQRREISAKYRLTEDSYNAIRYRLDSFSDDRIYVIESRTVEENDLYLPKIKLPLTQKYEYLRIRQRGADTFLTLKVTKPEGLHTHIRDNYEVEFRNHKELLDILRRLGFDIDDNALEINKKREIVRINVLWKPDQNKLTPKRSEFMLNFDEVEHLGSFIQLNMHLSGAPDTQAVSEKDHDPYKKLLRELAGLMEIPESYREPKSYLKLMIQAREDKK
ncbi:CYTH domain-containing protein [Desulfococcaceae bacterium HSG9]|nr:CYTH domain-containing protein [Desulfococcaceae bacterium HSG9]